MTHNTMGNFYNYMNLPLREKLFELENLIDQSGPKDLQSLFPQLISNIFGGPCIGNGWELKSVTSDFNMLHFQLLHKFLEPQGPLFRLCYKLLADPQLKYDLPIQHLPADLRSKLERDRCPQFYADLLNVDSQSMQVVALSLNPFDYYIFHFGLHLVNNNESISTWEKWNSVYFALACDYLMHFLPTDPNLPVLPPIPYYTGKVPVIAPLQTSNRPVCAPSLLLIPGISNQPPSASQSQPRNEVWRTETVLQVFIDVWMSVEDCYTNGVMNCPSMSPPPSSTERVRIVRVLVKHIHAFASRHLVDPTPRSAALRKYARQLMCTKAYRYVKYLVATWPLDASFRLVLECWLSLIQPWRYTGNVVYSTQDGNRNNNQEENAKVVDASYIQFIAENFPSYTYILQMIIPRFMRLDLTAPKNAIILFRLGKVFSQQNLVSYLIEIEQAIMSNTSGVYQTADANFNHSFENQSYPNNIPPNKLGAIAEQSITEMNMSGTFSYQSVWCEGSRQFVLELIKKVITAMHTAQKTVIDMRKKLDDDQGFWSFFNAIWPLMGMKDEQEINFEEYKKVPVYLNTAVIYLCRIFGFDENAIMPSEEQVSDDIAMESSSFMNSSSFQQNITNKLRNTSTNIKYMGDPDLMPITSYESTILVRILYQIATRINEVYQEQFSNLWQRNDFLGKVTHEILQEPRIVQYYMKDASHTNIVSQELPARLSLRRLATYAIVVWITFGYIFFRFFGYNAVSYIFTILLLWLSVVLTKASVNSIRERL